MEEKSDMPLKAFKKLHKALNGALDEFNLNANDALCALVYLNAEVVSNICACNDVSVEHVYKGLEKNLRDMMFSDEMKAAIADKKQQTAEQNEA